MERCGVGVAPTPVHSHHPMRISSGKRKAFLAETDLHPDRRQPMHPDSTSEFLTAGRELTRPIEYPLSLGQRDVWMQSQLYPDGDVSKLSLMFSVWAPLDLPVFRQSLDLLTERHEILRTVFPADGSQPVARVLPEFQLDCPLVDCAGIERAEREEDQAVKIAAAKEHARELLAQSFDLANGPLLRARLLRFREDWHCLVLAFHRLILDGLHGAQLMNELAAIYGSLKRGEPLPRAPLIQYGQFAIEQQERLASGQIESNSRYWLGRLREPLPQMALPADFDPPAQRSSETALHTHYVAAELTDDLRKLQKQLRATAIQITTAALVVLLHRMTGDPDFLIAVPCSTRPKRATGTIGFFSGILPLRIEVPAGIVAHDLVRSVSHEFRKGMERREFPWTEVLNRCKSASRASRSLLPVSVSQIGIVARKGAGAPGDLTMVGIGGFGSASSHDLSLIVQEQSRLLLRFSYARKLFDDCTIRQWGSYMEGILRTFVAAPDTPVEQIPLGETDQAIAPCPAPVVAARTLDEHFRNQARLRPQAIAVTCGFERVDYGSLDRRANQWAHWLVRNRMGEVALIRGENSIRTIEAIAGAVRAGVSYRVVSTKSRPIPGCEVLDLERISYVVEGLPAEPPPMHPAQDGAASGASAAPWSLEPMDSVLLPSLDGPAGIYAVWHALASGARIVMAVEQDVVSAGRLLARETITVLSLNATQFAILAESIPEALEDLRLAVVSGGVAPGKLFRRAAARLKKTGLIYGYCPSGSWSFVAATDVTQDQRSWIRPPMALTGVEPVQILAPDGSMAPAGAFGRIQLGEGRSLRITSDSGRLRPDGSLELAGSDDESFQVDGIRPSLQDVVQVLGEHPRVTDSAIIATTNRSGRRRLAAFVEVASAENFEEKDLRTFLAAKLPSYLLPSIFVPVAPLPRTRDGRIDQAALPELDSWERENYRAPRTPEQAAIAAIWEEALGLDRVGIDDNFFELGGHSIGVAKVSQLIRERLGIEFPPTAMFEHSTIAAMTKRIAAIRDGERESRQGRQTGGIAQRLERRLDQAQQRRLAVRAALR